MNGVKAGAPVVTGPFVLTVDASALFPNQKPAHYAISIDPSKLKIIYEVRKYIQCLFNEEGEILLKHKESTIHDLQSVEIFGLLGFEVAVVRGKQHVPPEDAVERLEIEISNDSVPESVINILADASIICNKDKSKSRSSKTSSLEKNETWDGSKVELDKDKDGLPIVKYTKIKRRKNSVSEVHTSGKKHKKVKQDVEKECDSSQTVKNEVGENIVENKDDNGFEIVAPNRDEEHDDFVMVTSNKKKSSKMTDSFEFVDSKKLGKTINNEKSSSGSDSFEIIEGASSTGQLDLPKSSSTLNDSTVRQSELDDEAQKDDNFVHVTKADVPHNGAQCSNSKSNGTPRVKYFPKISPMAVGPCLAALKLAESSNSGSPEKSPEDVADPNASSAQRKRKRVRKHRSKKESGFQSEDIFEDSVEKASTQEPEVYRPGKTRLDNVPEELSKLLHLPSHNGPPTFYRSNPQ